MVRAVTSLALAACFTLLALGRTSQFGVEQLMLGDADDYMRLVQIRDFLAGQSWWDVTQYRMADGAYGNMHWSRLPDVPFVLLLALFSLFASPERAEILALIVTPALYLAATLAFAGIAARNLGGKAAEIASYLLVLTLPLALIQFTPGRIDHHGLQLALLAALLAATTGERTFRNGVWAAVASALSLHVGFETAPLLAIVAVTLAMLWILRPAEYRRLLRGYLLGMVIAMPLIYIATVPPQDWLRAAADQVGRAHLGIVLIGGIGALIALDRTSATLKSRVLGMALAALLTTPVFALCPELFSAPYAHIDPEISAIWIDAIGQTASIFDTLRSAPYALFTYYLLPLASIAAGSYLLMRRGLPGELIVALAVLVAATLIGMWQIRAVSAAALAAVPVAAAVIAALWERRARAGGLAWPLAGLLVLNGFSGAIIQANLQTRDASNATPSTGPAPSLGSDRPIIVEGAGSCEDAVARARLDQVPRGLVLSGIDPGPMILLRSRHSVLAASYHRNVAGNSVALRSLLADPDEAKAILEDREVDYVFYCPNIDFGGHEIATETSLGAVIADGDPPDWLELIDSGEEPDWAFYRIR